MSTFWSWVINFGWDQSKAWRYPCWWDWQWSFTFLVTHTFFTYLISINSFLWGKYLWNLHSIRCIVTKFLFMDSLIFWENRNGLYNRRTEQRSSFEAFSSVVPNCYHCGKCLKHWRNSLQLGLSPPQNLYSPVNKQEIKSTTNVNSVFLLQK